LLYKGILGRAKFKKKSIMGLNKISTDHKCGNGPERGGKITITR